MRIRIDLGDLCWIRENLQQNMPLSLTFNNCNLCIITRNTFTVSSAYLNYCQIYIQGLSMLSFYSNASLGLFAFRPIWPISLRINVERQNVEVKRKASNIQIAKTDRDTGHNLVATLFVSVICVRFVPRHCVATCFRIEPCSISEADCETILFAI